ncbi:MAG: M28 family peptidase [Bacteroidales bacterium]|nr:M28 family peptidase [Candidatus Cacconaster merdequi]
MKFRHITILAAILVAGCSTEGQSVRPGITSSDDTLLRRWISTIGSDDFGGRKPTDEYEEKTTSYLIEEMEKLGLEPAFDGKWLQEVDMISTVVRPQDGNVSLSGVKGAADLLFPDDVTLWTDRATGRINIEECGFIFAGFGIDAPEYGWNDFEGIDVKGKVIIAMVNDPGFYDPELFNGRNMTYYGRFTYKFEQAEKMGAAGCLVIHNTEAASYGWDVVVNGHLGENLALFDKETGNAGALAFKGWLNENGFRKIAQAAGLDSDLLTQEAKKPGFKAIALDVKGDVKLDVSYKTDVSHNVAGVLPGTDLKDEAVVFSAHWDHFGTSKPDESGDSIYNGASDNGSGIAALLLLAKKFGSLPIAPRRSIVFLFPTLEESGLLGSRCYCENPAFPMEKTATCINFDCIAPAALTEDISFLGGGQSCLDFYVMASAAAQGRYAYFDDDNSDGWFYRSDHYNFVKRGVPALVMENGSHLVNPDKPNKYPQKEWYHQPSDEYHEDWDLSGTIANINVMFGAACAIANSDTLPRLTK